MVGHYMKARVKVFIPRKGFYIEHLRYNDGSIATFKILKCNGAMYAFKH